MMDPNNCPKCQRPMVSLFLSKACDWCDYPPASEMLHAGWIVWYTGVSESDRTPEEYVFRTKMDAERWKEAAGRDDNFKVTRVYACAPFRWHLSRGTLRDVVLADHMYNVHPNHQYPPGGHDCYIAPDQGDS